MDDRKKDGGDLGDETCWPPTNSGPYVGHEEGEPRGLPAFFLVSFIFLRGDVIVLLRILLAMEISSTPMIPCAQPGLQRAERSDGCVVHFWGKTRLHWAAWRLGLRGFFNGYGR